MNNSKRIRAQTDTDTLTLDSHTHRHTHNDRKTMASPFIYPCSLSLSLRSPDTMPCRYSRYQLKMVPWYPAMWYRGTKLRGTSRTRARAKRVHPNTHSHTPTLPLTHAPLPRRARVACAPGGACFTYTNLRAHHYPSRTQSVRARRVVRASFASRQRGRERERERERQG